MTRSEPHAGRHPAVSALDEILALASLIVQLGMAGDVAFFDLASVLLKEVAGDFAVQVGEYGDASNVVLRSLVAGYVTRADAARDAVSVGSVSMSDQAAPPTEVLELDEACLVELGATLTELSQFLGEAVRFAVERDSGIVSVPRASFLENVGERLSWTSQKAEAAATALELRVRLDYLVPPDGFEKNDIWPWRFNRAQSYIRRPLVRVPGGDGDQLYFSPGHVKDASENLIGLILSGRYKAQTTELRRAIGKLTAGAGEFFNDEVADILEASGLLVRRRFTGLPGRPIRGVDNRDLGDVDVLAADVVTRRLYVIECKDFSMARAPHEVRLDTENLFVSTPTKRCVQEKHRVRADWVRSNLGAVLRELKVSDESADEWATVEVLAFSRELVSPLLSHADMLIWTLDELRRGEWVADDEG